MKYKLILLIISILLLNSCNSNATETYISALKSTSSIDIYESKSISKFKIDLSQASQKDIYDLKDFSNITYNIDKKFNKDKGLIRGYISSEQFLFDYNIYFNSKDIFLKSVITEDKYYKLNDPKKANPYFNNSNFNAGLITEYTNFIAKEALSNLGSTITNTPDGDIKVTKISITLNEKKSKALLQKIIKLIDKNDSLKDFLKSSINSSELPFKSNNKFDFAKIDSWISNLMPNYNNFEKKLRINTIELTASIDKDDYIIEQNLLFDVDLYNINSILNFKFNQKSTIWSINDTSLNVTLPKINSSNTIKELKDFPTSLKNNKLYNDVID